MSSFARQNLSLCVSYFCTKKIACHRPTRQSQPLAYCQLTPADTSEALTFGWLGAGLCVKVTAWWKIPLLSVSHCERLRGSLQAVHGLEMFEGCYQSPVGRRASQGRANGLCYFQLGGVGNGSGLVWKEDFTLQPSHGALKAFFFPADKIGETTLWLHFWGGKRIKSSSP